MLKITDTNYFLPLLDAISGGDLFESGTTQPMLIRGVCRTTGEKSDYVVKYISSPRMSIKSSTNELIASFIAGELGLNVAEPAIINVSELFVDTLRGKDGFKYAANSIGINFGCKYVSGFYEFIRNQKLSAKQFEEAEKIFAFDVFISNPDRGPQGKQNLLTDGENVLIFDHELAFSFLFDLFYKNPTPWILSDADKNIIKKHFFFNVLRENKHNFDYFVESFEVINEDFWNKVNDLLPADWNTSQVLEIKNNLTALTDNKEVFLQELYRVLS